MMNGSYFAALIVWCQAARLGGNLALPDMAPTAV